MKTLTIIVALFCCSCGVQPANLQVAQQFLDDVACCLHPPADSFKSCIVIPDEGCSGCIRKSTRFVADKIDSLSGHLIIFTGVKDMKMLSMTLGKNFLSRDNVLIDSSNILMSPGFASIYPQVIELKNGNAIRISLLQLP